MSALLKDIQSTMNWLHNGAQEGCGCAGESLDKWLSERANRSLSAGLMGISVFRLISDAKPHVCPPAMS